MRILLVAHGTMAKGIKDALTLLLGDRPDISAIEFNNQIGVGELHEIILQQIHENEEYLIFTDLKGGSPFNVASVIAHDHKNILVFFGMNLPLVLEAAMLEDDIGLSNAKKVLEGIIETSMGFSDL